MSPPAKPSPQTAQRLAKRIAAAGVCSRRAAEGLITAGRVAVDGVVVRECATKVTDSQPIAVDGKPLPKQPRPRLWCYHKPRGLVVSHRDNQNRPTMFARLQAHHPHLPRLISVGRLDLDSEGLILLTNTGSLARHLELPSSGWLRTYRLRVYATQPKATPLPEVCQMVAGKSGITIDGMHYRPISARIDYPSKTGGSNVWLTIGLHEGKNREIRRVMAHFGYATSRLIRVGFGGFRLGKLAAGEISEVSAARLKPHLPTTTNSTRRVNSRAR